MSNCYDKSLSMVSFSKHSFLKSIWLSFNMRRFILPWACISNSWPCNNLNVIITFVMFRLRITRPGGRCMCKLQAGVRRGEERRGRNAEIVVVTPLPDTLLLFIPITLNIGVNIVQSRVFSGQNDGSGPKYLRTWENIRNTRRVGYLTNDSRMKCDTWAVIPGTAGHCAVYQDISQWQKSQTYFGQNNWIPGCKLGSKYYLYELLMLNIHISRWATPANRL